MKSRTFAHLTYFLAGSSLLPHCALASDYTQRKAAAITHCETVNPGDYQTGLAFNPDGYRSFYVRSQCFQNAAVQFRDASLCDRVRQRWSLFSSSWGISTAQCGKLVAQATAADRVAIDTEKQRYLAGTPKLSSFQIQRNGNGRDYDIVPDFTTGYPHGYTLTFEIVEVRDQPILLHSDGYYLDQNPRLRIFVRQSEIRSRLPELQLNHPYKIRATVTLSLGNGGMSGYYSDEFLESVFPAHTRSVILTEEAEF